MGSRQTKELVVCLLSSAIFILLCHGFMMLNPCYSHDSLTDFVRVHDGVQVGLGRFGQIIWRDFFGRVTASWWIGLVAAVCIGFSSFLISEICNTKKQTTNILITGVLATNYTICNSVATYMSWVDIYGGALLFSIASVYLAVRYKYGFLAGIPFVVVALSLYQPYVLCIPALAVCCVLVRMAEMRKWILFLGKTAIMVLLGYVVYGVVFHLLLKISGIALITGYNGITNVGIPESMFLQPWKEICGVYESFFHYAFAVFDYIPFSVIWIVLFIIAFVLSVVTYQKRMLQISKWEIVAFYLILAVTPLIFNVQFIVSKSAYHVLMVFSVFFIWVLMVLFYDKTYQEIPSSEFDTARRISGVIKGLRILIFAITAIFLFANMRYANNIYTGKYLRERSTLSLMTRIMSQAENTQGYRPENMPIVLVGDLGNNPIIGESDPAFYGPEIGDPGRFLSITYDYNSYLQYYMGYTNLESSEVIQSNEEVAGMPAYPEEGFAKVINGKLVVKISR